jgi:hypothetical protein
MVQQDHSHYTVITATPTIENLINSGFLCHI